MKGGKEAFLSKVTFRRESNWYSNTKQMLKDMATIEERAKAIDDVKVSEIYEWIDKHAIVIEGLNGAFVNAYELKDIINNLIGEE